MLTLPIGLSLPSVARLLAKRSQDVENILMDATHGHGHVRTNTSFIKYILRKKHVSKMGRWHAKYCRGKNVFGHCAELVSLQKQDHLIHSSIHDESIGPELETQL